MWLVLYIKGMVSREAEKLYDHTIGTGTPLISSKDLALPVKANCIGCSLMYPLLPICFSIPRHPCGLFDDLQPIRSHNPVICWSGWPQNLSMANHVCPWATEGLRKAHTQTHTDRQTEKKTLQRRMHICTHSVRSTCRWKNYVFSTGWSPLSAGCSETLCVLIAKSITGSHILRNTDWILNQKHDLNQQTWANEISSAQTANQTSRINPGKSKVCSRLECSCRHFWTTGCATTKGVTSTRHKGPFHIHDCMRGSRVLLCTSPVLLRAKAPRLKGSSPNSWLCSS